MKISLDVKMLYNTFSLKKVVRNVVYSEENH